MVYSYVSMTSSSPLWTFSENRANVMQVSNKFFRYAYFIIPQRLHILSSMPVGQFTFTEFPLASFYYRCVCIQHFYLIYPTIDLEHVCNWGNICLRCCVIKRLSRIKPKVNFQPCSQTIAPDNKLTNSQWQHDRLLLHAPCQLRLG